MRLGFQDSRAAGGEMVRARTTSRKAGAKRVNLVFDGLGVVESGAIGDVAVGPGGVFAFRRSGGVEEAGLDEDDEGFVVEVACGPAAF